jgi:hypothetical protein
VLWLWTGFRLVNGFTEHLYHTDSELQVITAPPLIPKIHKSPQHPLSLFQPAVFTSRYTATASNSEDSSASRAQVVSSQAPVQNCVPANPSLESRVTLRLAVYRRLVRIGVKPLETHDQYFFSTEHLRSQFFCNILSDKRMGLSFTIADGPRQRSHSRVRVLQDSWPCFTFSDSRFP